MGGAGLRKKVRMQKEERCTKLHPTVQHIAAQCIAMQCRNAAVGTKLECTLQHVTEHNAKQLGFAVNWSELCSIWLQCNRLQGCAAVVAVNCIALQHNAAVQCKEVGLLQ